MRLKMNRLDNVLNDILWSIFGDYGVDNLAIDEAIEAISDLIEAEREVTKEYKTLEDKYKVAIELAAEYRLESEMNLVRFAHLLEATKPKVLYGTKYPDPRPCTKNSHFIEHEQSDCGCGYTKGMSK